MVERRLAAILAADVVGYSRLMGADETGVLALLRALRAEVFDPAIARNHGRIVKLMGDGTLVEFGSVVDAVTCAAEVQAALKDRNTGLEKDERLELRIGINLGDVMVEGDDLYGDGVNVAARLEGLAEPGGICVSEDVVRQATGKVDAGFVDLGEQQLKNIETPVRAFRVVEQGADNAEKKTFTRKRPRWTMAAAAVFALAVATGAGWYAFAPTDAPAIDVDKVLTIKGPAIAALPFENLSGDAEQDLFARGMTEQIAAALTRFKGVRVLSLKSTAEHAESLKALRTELKADYVLEGNVRRSTDRVRVTAVLTTADEGERIWTDSFDAELTAANIIDVQDKIAGQIAAALADDWRGAIAIDRFADQYGRAPDSLSVYECALNGIWRSAEEMQRGYDCLSEAVNQDPTYGTGWARLAVIYTDSYWTGQNPTGRDDYEPIPMALEASEKAVRFSPDSSTAHATLAEVYFYMGQHDKFLDEAAKAIELNPNDAGNIGYLGARIAFIGRWDEGVALVEKAHDFNPSVVSASTWYAPAKAHYFRGEYDESLEDFEKVWAARPGYWLNDVNAAYLYASWGKQNEAEEAVARLLGKKPDYAVEDAEVFYRIFHFPDDFIDKMVAALKQAGLPSREDGT